MSLQEKRRAYLQLMRQAATRPDWYGVEHLLITSLAAHQARVAQLASAEMQAAALIGQARRTDPMPQPLPDGTRLDEDYWMTYWAAVLASLESAT